LLALSPGFGWFLPVRKPAPKINAEIMIINAIEIPIFISPPYPSLTFFDHFVNLHPAVPVSPRDIYFAFMSVFSMRTTARQTAWLAVEEEDSCYNSVTMESGMV